MKKLSLYVFLGLLWCNVSVAKDLTGVQLLCDGYTDYTAMGIDFKSSNKGFFYEIKNEKGWIIEKDEITYSVTPDHIFMKGKEYLYKPSLSRKTLKLNNTFQCEELKLKSTTKFEWFMDFVLEEFKKESESENKL